MGWIVCIVLCRCLGVRFPSPPPFFSARLIRIGVPVATVGINNSINAALLAARILGTFDSAVQQKVEAYAEAARVENTDSKGVKMREIGWERYFNEA